MTEGVLVIYNTVNQEAPVQKGRWRESNAGVLEEVKAVTGSLEKLGIDYDVQSISRISQLPLVLSHSKQTVVFNLVEELPENILDTCYVPAVCLAHGRRCTGSDTASLLLAQDKWKSKAVLKAANLPCPEGVIVPIGQKIRLTDLSPGVYIVKPVFSDASEGIDINSIVAIETPPSVLGTPYGGVPYGTSGELPGDALRRAIERIHTQLEQPAIVEQFIAQRELNVSILQHNGDVKVLPIAEIDFTAFQADRPRIVDYAAKWQNDSFAYNNTPRVIPADLSKRMVRLIEQYALGAWYAIGCQDYTRVDFRIDDNAQVFVLEVNPNPDISPDAGFAAALAAAGIAYDQFVETIIKNSLLRQR
jgi:D-alanine-D-alanine ligase